jgi:parallel beta-helix repeat protein
MTTYYVSNTATNGFAVGSDANSTAQAQSKSTPWLTIAGALAKVASGDTLRLNAGTYDEGAANTVWYCNGVFTSTVTIQSDSGVASGVIVRSNGLAGTNNIRLGRTGNLAYLKFYQVSFSAKYAGMYDIVEFYNCNHVTLDSCVFILAAGSTATWAVCTTGASTVSNCAITNCSISQTDLNVSCNGIIFGDGGATCTNCTLTNNTVNVIGSGITAVQGTGYAITGNTCTSCTSYGILFGSDGYLVTTLTGDCSNNQVLSEQGHGMLVGYGATGSTILNNRVVGGNDAFVIKGCTNNTFTGNIAWGGTVSAWYFKACTGNTCTDNLIVQVNAACAVSIQNDSTRKAGNNTFTGNKIFLYGAATLYYVLGDAGDSGGNVLNNNEIHLCGTGKFGEVRGTVAIATLAGLLAAWASYGNGSNDSTSFIANNARPRGPF